MRPIRILSSFVVIGMLLFAASFVRAVELPENKIVSTDWLMEHLDDEGLRIIDIRDLITSYWEGHIPGAVYLNAEALRLSEDGTPVMLIPPQMLADKLGRMGITRGTSVVVYTETGDYKAPFLVWALDYIGHPSSAVMEGGFGKWQGEGLPVTQDYPDAKPVMYPLPKMVRVDVRATLGQAKTLIASGGAAMVDVRATVLYTGERGFWKRNGHIPGFKGHFWGDDLTPEGVWKSRDDPQKAYAETGTTGDKPILVMCGQGLMSAHAYFTMKYLLGFENVLNFDGGFHQWVMDDALPVATGTE
ncbi:MAG: sulfurtransferase [Candidatus Poribacteria bacterium]|nr:sulfurtransferase [Candidatus Poribacteria bacterium]